MFDAGLLTHLDTLHCWAMPKRSHIRLLSIISLSVHWRLAGYCGALGSRRVLQVWLISSSAMLEIYMLMLQLSVRCLKGRRVGKVIRWSSTWSLPREGCQLLHRVNHCLRLMRGNEMLLHRLLTERDRGGLVRR